MKVVAIVQARVGSTRLPGKVLKALPYGSGVPSLARVLRRLSKATSLDEILIATTTDKSDDRIEALAQKESVRCFRGSVEDVLSRYYLAAEQCGADVIVRVTGDCPCIDPRVVDMVVARHLDENADFTSNIITRTMPHGLDTEVLSFSALTEAHQQADKPFEREHVCPYIYKSNPSKFHICEAHAPEELCAPDIRITLDTPQDYVLLCAVFDFLYSDGKCFSTEQIISLFRAKPWLKEINADVIHKKVFDSLEAEIEEALRVLQLQGLGRAEELLQGRLKK